MAGHDCDSCARPNIGTHYQFTFIDRNNGNAPTVGTAYYCVSCVPVARDDISVIQPI